MGKKRVAKKGFSGDKRSAEGGRSSGGRLSRKTLEKGVLYIQATYNNTKATLTDEKGDTVVWASSGNLGFKGARKSTPFAAAKVGEELGEKAKMLGTKEVSVVLRGVGSGRESCVRGFLARSGSGISTMEDRTPIPFNGPRPPKPRRV